MDILTCKIAKAKGGTRYFTGKPCPQGHFSERMVSTRACVECLYEKKKRWSTENPEKVNKQKREYYANNTEKVKAWKRDEQLRNRESYNRRNRKYADNNREKLKEKNALWAMGNKDKRAATAAKYRASKLQATPLWADDSKISRAYELALEYRCKGINAEVDHIIPLQGKDVCGLHVQTNLQIIHQQLNRSKSNYFKGEKLCLT